MKNTKEKTTTTPANCGNTVLTAGLIKEIFTAAEYEFTEEKPEGRLLFYDHQSETNVQFWYKNAIMHDVISFIQERAYDSGFTWGQSTKQQQVRDALGL